MALNWFKKKKPEKHDEVNPPIEPEEPQVEINAVEPAITEEETPVAAEANPAADAEAAPVIDEHPADAAPEKPHQGYFARLKQGLAKTRHGFADIFLGKKVLDQALVDDLEMQLLTSDVGIEVTNELIQEVTEKIDRKALTDAEAVQHSLSERMSALLTPYEQPLDTTSAHPFVILMIGINGAGKTTTIGKLAKRLQNEGKKVMLAAGDTFRAAAVEQLQVWGERNHVPVIAQSTGADSASVAYDALQSAKARNMDVLIIDTAGRLHTQDNLMEELKKIKRVLQKIDANVPQEVMLVIDAGNGQNALRQAQVFNEAMHITGITLTKLDGTAKGGIIFAIANSLKLPIRYIGVGEKADDLRPFNAKSFVNALLYSE